MAAGRRAFGSLRTLPSGRVQVRYIAPNGLRRNAPMTFPDEAAAKRWLRLCEADMIRGTWVDTTLGGASLAEFGNRWIDERSGLSERTRVLYKTLMRLHIEPPLGKYELRQVDAGTVRTWRQGLLDGGLGPSTVAKSYRLLRSIFATAVDDALVPRNPCRIRGAAIEKPAERPVLTLEEVGRLAEAIEPRYRLLVLLAVFGSLRWGELLGLRKSDFDLDTSTVRISRAVSELGSKLTIKEPKTAAGLRRVSLPASLVPAIREHFATFAEAGPSGRVFIGPQGATPLRANFSRVWKQALVGAGLSGFRVHDLRHTGNHMASMTGASTRELMGRMGHANLHAALLYQHRTADRDRAIAEGMDALAEAQMGTDWARSGHDADSNDEGRGLGPAGNAQ